MSDKRAIKVVILLGLVSLFADVTYEGSRGILGPFLHSLGASATVVGLTSGLGELIGYGLRLVFGYIADKTKKYWAMTILGYLINLIAVPLLAFAKRWEVVSGLVIAERFGKAIRTPARDTIISYASSKIGYGRGFGLHEAIDQIGAIIGPLIVAWVIHLAGSYSLAFLSLGIPAILSVVTLLLTIAIYPKPEVLEDRTEKIDQGVKRLSKIFYFFLLFSMLTICGYPHFQIISYHLKRIQIVSDEVISSLYALAMATDVLTALIIGRVFDKFKLKTLFIIPLFGIPVPILIFIWENLISAIVGVALWGVVMGLYETILKATVAVIIPAQNRSLAYGIFHSLFGIAWFTGGAVIGWLYETSIVSLFAFSIGLQILSLICSVYLFLLTIRQAKNQ